MAIMISAYSAPRPNGFGVMSAQPLHLHPGCPGIGCDAGDSIGVNYVGDAYAIMRALRSGLRYDEGRNAYVRNRIQYFQLWGSVATEDFYRDDVDALDRGPSCPDSPEYGEWRAKVIASAKPGQVAVTESRMISPDLARAVGIKGVHLWTPTDDRKPSAGRRSRINDTTAASLTVGSDNPKPSPVYVTTLPDSHRPYGGQTVRDVHGHEGKWFTVPGDFPADLPDVMARQSPELFAVYQSPNVVAGALVWVMVSGMSGGRTLGRSTESRHMAVREGLAKLAELRGDMAEEIADKRAAAGLEPTRPVRLSQGDSGAFLVHVRCGCNVPPRDLMCETETPGGVAEFIDRGPWAMCENSPRFLLAADGTRVGRVTGSGGFTGEGAPSLSITDMQGQRPAAVRLTELAGYAL